MRFKPIKNKDGNLPKFTEKMAKTAVKIDSEQSWWVRLKKRGIEIGVKIRV